MCRPGFTARTTIDWRNTSACNRNLVELNSTRYLRLAQLGWWLCFHGEDQKAGRMLTFFSGMVCGAADSAVDRRLVLMLRRARGEDG